MAFWRTEDGGLFDTRSAAGRNIHFGPFNGTDGWLYVRLEDGTEVLVQSQHVATIQVTPQPARVTSGQQAGILLGSSS